MECERKKKKNQWMLEFMLSQVFEQPGFGYPGVPDLADDDLFKPSIGTQGQQDMEFLLPPWTTPK